MVTEEATVDVNDLLERAIADPMAICQLVLRQLLGQLVRQYAVDEAGGELPEEAIAAALGNRIAQMIVNEDGPPVSRWPAGAAAPDVSPEQDELLDRDAALAAALGACDCWGEHEHCPICGGAGTPGWELPDRQLFAEYVYPALRALTQRDAPRPARGRTSEDNRKENGNV
jgi:hypothetical protein